MSKPFDHDDDARRRPPSCARAARDVPMSKPTDCSCSRGCNAATCEHHDEREREDAGRVFLARVERDGTPERWECSYPACERPVVLARWERRVRLWVAFCDLHSTSVT